MNSFENLGSIKRREINESLIAEAKENFTGISNLEARLLAARGVTKPDISIRKLLTRPLKDQMVGAKRIYNAIKKKEKIMVVADYDCDGATSCALMVKGLTQLGARIDYVVPDRMIHGYGISPSVVDLAKEHANDVRVIVTVDNGIMGHAGITYANNLGLDVIVTDHHLPGDTLPDALAIINPNRHDCSSSLGKLAGVGVALWLVLAVRGLCITNGDNPAPMGNLLSLLAVGTVADLVPLGAANRRLVSAGLKLLREPDAPVGIRALMYYSGIDRNFMITSNIGFGIAPRLNAAGRLKNMRQGIDLLLTDDRYKAQKLAQELCTINDERKKIQKQATEQAQDDIKSAIAALDDKFTDYTIVKANCDWHQGIIGLVASRLKDLYYKPTFVFSTDGGVVKGSGRSIPGFHLKDALEEVARIDPHVLKQFGGHAMAAGASLTGISAVDPFKKCFEQVAQKWISKETFNRQWLSDGPLPELSTERAFDLLNRPWGQGFEAPAFDSTGKVLSAKALGKDGKHWRISAKLDGTNSDTELLLFNQPKPSIGMESHFYIEPNLNTYNGKTKTQWIGKVFSE